MDIQKIDGQSIVGIGDGLPAMGKDGTGKYRLLLLDGSGRLVWTPPQASSGVYGVVAITTVAQIRPANASRVLLFFAHSGPDTLYVGLDGSVTTANGFPLLPFQPYAIREYTGALFGVSDGGALSVRFEEF